MSSSSTTIGIAGAVILLLIVLLAYCCGGYVAGRMARFNGVKQGVAVWLWAVAIAVVVAVLGGLAGMRFHRKVDHLRTDRADGLGNTAT